LINHHFLLNVAYIQLKIYDCFEADGQFYASLHQQSKALALDRYFIFAQRQFRKAVAAFHICSGLARDAGVDVPGGNLGFGHHISLFVFDRAQYSGFVGLGGRVCN
jgi:hypothetical protein